MPNRSPSGQPSSKPRIVEKGLSYAIVGCFFAVYNELGYGFNESVYAKALQVALEQIGIRVEREVLVEVVFRGVVVGKFRIDMLVEGRVIVELKSTERLADASKRQVRNQLSAAHLELGLLVHFGPKAEYHRILRPRGANPEEIDSAHSMDSDE